MQFPLDENVSTDAHHVEHPLGQTNLTIKTLKGNNNLNLGLARPALHVPWSGRVTLAVPLSPRRKVIGVIGGGYRLNRKVEVCQIWILYFSNFLRQINVSHV